MAAERDFVVVTSGQVARALNGQEMLVRDLVRDTYLDHDAGRTVNPPSYFLTFPDAPRNRIIALPGALTGEAPVSGIKWISSWPGNVSSGSPRASAVTVLNDAATGFPTACLESSLISAARTAASAALAAEKLSEGRARPSTVSFIGAGPIARTIHRYLVGTGWSFSRALVHDLSRERAESFAASIGEVAEVAAGSERAIREAELVVFATVASAPHVVDPNWFSHHPLVLHISLRDLGEEVIVSAQNIVDDVNHVLQANTSVHLVAQRTGDRGFIDGTIAQVVRGQVTPRADSTVVFSPFGLGVLDLALARYVLESMPEDERINIPGFFSSVGFDTDERACLVGSQVHGS
jgi:ornithine cyclodeaminase